MREEKTDAGEKTRKEKREAGEARRNGSSPVSREGMLMLVKPLRLRQGSLALEMDPAAEHRKEKSDATEAMLNVDSPLEWPEDAPILVKPVGVMSPSLLVGSKAENLNENSDAGEDIPNEPFVGSCGPVWSLARVVLGSTLVGGDSRSLLRAIATM